MLAMRLHYIYNVKSQSSVTVTQVFFWNKRLLLQILNTYIYENCKLVTYITMHVSYYHAKQTLQGM